MQGWAKQGLQRGFTQLAAGPLVPPGPGTTHLWCVLPPSGHSAGLGKLCSWTALLDSPGSSGTSFWLLLAPTPWYRQGPVHTLSSDPARPTPVTDLPIQVQQQWLPGRNCTSVWGNSGAARPPPPTWPLLGPSCCSCPEPIPGCLTPALHCHHCLWAARRRP